MNRPTSGDNSANYEFDTYGFGTTTHGAAFAHGPANIPTHRHRQMEILMLMRGTLRLTIDGWPVDMRAGDLVLINPGAPHSSSTTSEDALVCGVHIDPDHFEGLGLTEFSTRQFRCNTALHGQAFQDRIAPIKSLIARIILLPKGAIGQDLTRQVLFSVLAHFIHEKLRYDTDTPGHAKRAASGKTRIERLIHAVHEGSGMMSLSDFAASEGLTVSHLSRLFKDQVGVGFRTYLIKARLERAAQQLQTTNLPIAEIMEHEGFGNPTVFYRKFKETYGVSPAIFRKNMRAITGTGSMSQAQKQALIKSLSDHLEGVDDAVRAMLAIDKRNRKAISISAPHRAA
jgi:Response regulator containing CheY-like receiver domain and AraC-type DNA-binding domain